LASVFLQRPFLPIPSACASGLIRSGIRLFRRRSIAFPKVCFFVAASLPDEDKFAPTPESHNGEMQTYPQSDVFAVDNPAHNQSLPVYM
jgi:hypothetical protein